MKVLLINDYVNLIGGAEHVLHSTKAVLEENGHLVKMYAPSHAGSISGRLFSLKHFFAIRQEIRSFKPDIVHAHGVYRNVSPSVLMAAWHMKIPVVMTLHDFQIVCPKTSLINESLLNCEVGFGPRCFYSNCYPRKPFNRTYQGLKAIKLFLHRTMIKRTVQHYLSPSNALKDWTMKNLGVQNVSLLPNLILCGNDTSPNNPKNHTLLFVGNLVEQKGVDVLIKAVAKVRNIFSDVKLKIVGEGPEERNLQELVKDLKMSEHVAFTGKLPNDQVMKEYIDALIVIIPSKYAESFGIVGIEAMSKGKVIIASKIGGLPDLVVDNETGFLVRPNDPDDLSEKIIYILQNQTMLPEMGGHARTRFLKTFTKAAYYHSLFSVYNRIIHESRNRNSQF